MVGLEDGLAAPQPGSSVLALLQQVPPAQVPQLLGLLELPDLLEVLRLVELQLQQLPAAGGATAGTTAAGGPLPLLLDAQRAPPGQVGWGQKKFGLECWCGCGGGPPGESDAVVPAAAVASLNCHPFILQVIGSPHPPSSLKRPCPQVDALLFWDLHTVSQFPCHASAGLARCLASIPVLIEDVCIRSFTHSSFCLTTLLHAGRRAAMRQGARHTSGGRGSEAGCAGALFKPQCEDCATWVRAGRD